MGGQEGQGVRWGWAGGATGKMGVSRRGNGYDGEGQEGQGVSRIEVGRGGARGKQEVDRRYKV